VLFKVLFGRVGVKVKLVNKEQKRRRGKWWVWIGRREGGLGLQKG
jgi:hypothetical protein